MKNMIIRSLAVLMVIGAFTIVSFAQSNSKIIQFAAGKTSAVEKFTLTANDGITYLFKVKQGDVIKFSVTGLYTNGADAQGLTIKLTKLDKYDDVLAEASPGEEVEYQVNSGGDDYVITVMNPGTRRANIALNLTITPTSVVGNAKRIDFQKEGSNSLAWEERVAANSTKSFVFYAKKGQKLTLSFIDDTKQGSMDLGKVSIEPNGDPLEMVIEVSKDYIFSVTNNSNNATSFRIFITLENTDQTSNNTGTSTNSNTVRVQFARGETSTSITKDIQANGSVDFLINARKGQILDYTIGYDFKDSDIEAFLTEPGLQDTPKSSGPKERQEFVVKRSGDHRLTVNNTTGKKVTITLYLNIE